MLVSLVDDEATAIVPVAIELMPLLLVKKLEEGDQ